MMTQQFGRLQLPRLKEMDRPAAASLGVPPASFLETFISSSREPQTRRQVNPLSPISISSPLPSPWDNEPARKPGSYHPERTETKVINVLNPCNELTVPMVALKGAGGWFDHNNWLFKLTLNKFGNLNEDELLQAWYTRSADRPPYEEDHIFTKGKRQAEVSTPSSIDEYYISNRKQASENHKTQERDRRKRHQGLQKESDEATPDCVYNMAEEVLPYVKDVFKQLVTDETPANSSRKVKKTGKDEQLTAAAIMPHLSNVVIFRLLEARNKQEARAEEVERKLIFAEQKACQLERDNKRFQEHIARLRHQVDSGVGGVQGHLTTPDTLGPLPQGMKRKDGADNGTYVGNQRKEWHDYREGLSFVHVTKRARLEVSHHATGHPLHPHLPLSPNPSEN